MIIKVKKTRTCDIDRIIGGNIKRRRKQLGLRLDALAGILNVSLQQVQKYEKGINRTSAVTLWKISKFFQVPMDYFFE